MHKSSFFAMCEALLFSMSEPIREETIMQIVREEIDQIEGLNFSDFVAWFNTRDSGLRIIKVANSWLMVTRAEYSDAILRLKKNCQKARFSRAALETLAIIAYRQPITTPEIEQIRGVDSSGILKNLLVKKLITVLGRKRAPGNPLLYGTTRQFLVVFGLDSLDSLPKLEEFGMTQNSMHASIKNLPLNEMDVKNQPDLMEKLNETNN